MLTADAAAHTLPLTGRMHVDITVSIDARLAKDARKAARAMGKSLKQLIREYLATLAQGRDVERDIEEIRRLSARGQGRSRGWRFDRDQLHARS
jgi:hypothetical protein